MNTTDFLSIACAICPERDLILFEGRKFSYRLINDRVNRLANGLAALGLKKGDRAGILEVNCSQYIETYFACAKLGVLFVPLNFRAKSDELLYMIDNAEADLMFVGERYLRLADDLKPRVPSVNHWINIGGALDDPTGYEALVRNSTADEPAVDLDDGDVTILMYTASTITVLGPEDHELTGTDEEIEIKLNRLASSIGRPLPDVEVKIVDDEGRVLEPMQVGEILVKGPRVMSGYWKDDRKTSRVMTEDGWLKTSDRGWMDEDGYLFLAGRSDDIIIRGGENIAPAEVENVICSHPGVDEAAVIGVPDPEWGQEPKALVVLKPIFLDTIVKPV